MKRILALLLALSLMLCACGSRKDPAADTGDTGDSIQNSSNDTTNDSSSEDTAEESSSETTEETTEQVVLYRHPLTGVALDAPWNGQITGVMMNNLKKAMPQHGISQADILYEIEVEGDITRNLALFTNLSAVGTIGPIRSARTAFNSVAVSFEAPLVHCGGSSFALKGMYGDYNDTIAKWEHIDQSYNGKYFYRDNERYKNGYAWEHTLFATGELLQQAMNDKGYNTPNDHTFGLQFDDNIVLGGETANEVTVKFKGGKTTKLIYNADTMQYKLYQHGQDHVDGNTGLPVTFKNVIAIYTKQWYASDGMHKFYQLTGSGEGYAAINGQIVPILWSREGLRKPFTYTLKDGTPLTLDVGTTYIAVVGTKHPLSYQ